MNKRKRVISPERAEAQAAWRGYFSLCQEIGGRIRDAGRNIETSGVFAPAMYEQIMRDLRWVRGYAARAEAAIEQAQKMWRESSDKLQRSLNPVAQVIDAKEHP